MVPDDFGDQLIRIDHVGLAVADLDAAIELYTTTFGFTLVLREDNVEQGVSEAMLAVPRPVEATEEATAEPSAAARLQLLAPLGPDSTISRFLDRSGPGLQQLALTVRDVELAGAGLRERGVELLYPEARPGTDGSMINFVHPRDAGGVLLELVQPRRDAGSQPQSLPLRRMR